MSTHSDDWIRRHRLTVDEYYRMADIGLLAMDARTELIEGEIIDMTPPGSRHAGAVNFLTVALVEAVNKNAVVAVQQPLRLDAMSEPQPDAMVLKPHTALYSTAHPGPSDVLLVVEVSESSLSYDRRVKLPLYARHAIPEVWIVDLIEKKLHVHRAPGEGRYVDVRESQSPHLITLALLDATIDVTKLLEL